MEIVCLGVILGSSLKEEERGRKGRKSVKGRLMSCDLLDQRESCCGASERHMECNSELSSCREGKLRSYHKLLHPGGLRVTSGVQHLRPPRTEKALRQGDAGSQWQVQEPWVGGMGGGLGR